MRGGCGNPPAAMVDNIVVGFEDAVRQPIIAHEQPDVFRRVQLRAFRRQRQKGNVGGNVELGGRVPARLIEEQDGVRSRGDVSGDFLQMQVHGDDACTWAG